MKLFNENKKMAYHISVRFTPTVTTDREDIKQLALIGLYKASQNYKEDLGYAFSTYAYQVMRNEILKELTRGSDEPVASLDEMEWDVVDDIHTPDKEFHGSMERFAHLLNRDEYQVVLMTVEGYSQKQISEEIGLSQSQVSRIFIRAKNKIEEEINIAYID